MDKIYILKRKMLIRGPYTLHALQKRGLQNNDMIWYEGLKDWMPATQVDLFAGIVKYHEIHKQKNSFFERVFAFLK
ncbi:GYF domain-containing protein [Chitinophagaceae bacterium LWZ2-11]